MAGHGGPQRATAGHGGWPHQAAAGHGRPRRATAGHGGPVQRATANHHCRPRRTTAGHVGPRRATGGTRRATAGHGGPRRATRQATRRATPALPIVTYSAAPNRRRWVFRRGQTAEFEKKPNHRLFGGVVLYFALPIWRVCRLFGEMHRLFGRGCRLFGAVLAELPSIWRSCRLFGVCRLFGGKCVPVLVEPSFLVAYSAGNYKIIQRARKTYRKRWVFNCFSDAWLGPLNFKLAKRK